MDSSSTTMLILCSFLLLSENISVVAEPVQTAKPVSTNGPALVLRGHSKLDF